MRPHLGRFTTTTTTSNYFSYLAFWPVNFLRLFASPTPPPPSSSSSSPTTTPADHLKRASWTHRKQELFSKSGYKRPKQLLDSNATGLTWTERVENQLNAHTHTCQRAQRRHGMSFADPSHVPHTEVRIFWVRIKPRLGKPSVQCDYLSRRRHDI